MTYPRTCSLSVSIQDAQNVVAPGYLAYADSVSSQIVIGSTTNRDYPAEAHGSGNFTKDWFLVGTVDGGSVLTAPSAKIVFKVKYSLDCGIDRLAPLLNTG